MLDRFSVKFVENRRHELEKFMIYILSHPRLKNDQNIEIFLKGSELDLNEFKKETKPQSGGLLSMFTGKNYSEKAEVIDKTGLILRK